MISYVSVKVLLKDSGKVMLDRSLADCDMSKFPFGDVVSSLHALFPNCTVLIDSQLPKVV